MSETTPLLTSPQPQSTNNKSRRSTWLCICGTAILLSILAMTASQHPSSSFITFDSRTTILISLDGVRAEYLKRGITPTLQAIASHGIHAPYMIPSFPTLTWPNHYTIVTGLYPSVHGIVGNLFRDKPTNLTFDYMDFTSQKQSFWWEAGEPIWCTSERENVPTGVVMWPGSTATIRGVAPSFAREWDWRVDHVGRVDLGLQWLNAADHERPVFLGLYLSDVDHAGHMYGPESKQVEKELKDLDASILRLLKGVEGLSGRNWWDVVNVVVVSDHGMGLGNTREKFVFLDDFVDSARFSIVDDVVVHVYPNEGEDLNELFHHWKQASLTSGNWQVWKRDDCPAEFEYRGNERIGPIVVLPEPGWAVSKRVQGVLSKPFDIKGMHGYNNSHPDMRAIFLAGGPAFKTIPEEIPAFKNVEIHGLLSTLLRLKSSIPTNGTDSLSKYVDLK